MYIYTVSCTSIVEGGVALPEKGSALPTMQSLAVRKLALRVPKPNRTDQMIAGTTIKVRLLHLAIERDENATHPPLRGRRMPCPSLSARRHRTDPPARGRTVVPLATTDSGSGRGICQRG